MWIEKRTHQELIAKANAAVQAGRSAAAQSPHRLAYHIAAPAYWINDPNGVVQFQGEYHVFYQHHPYSADWGPMHWGHVKSKDLVHWEHLPIALAPSEEYESDGCFSGSAVDDDGVLTLIYTGNKWTNAQRTEQEQVQAIAVSTDGIHFDKYEGNPVIAAPPPEGSSHFRDPKVWKHGAFWYMIVGTCKEGMGKVALYRSLDLRDWTYVGIAVESDGSLGYMWECPDLFSLRGREVLLFSPQGMEPSGDQYQNLHQTGYVVGQLDYETGRLVHGAFTELDKGFDFYAAQTFADDKGRRILIAWMDMWESPMPTKEHGWAGALTIPRELTLHDKGHLLMNPVAELTELRQKRHEVPPQELVPGHNPAAHIQGDCLEIIAEFSLAGCTAEEFGLKVRCSADRKEETVISFHRETRTVTMDRNRSGAGVTGVRRSVLADSGQDRVIFRLFLDRSSVEAFFDDGGLVMSSRVYPDEGSLGVQVFAEQGSVQLLSMQAWELKDIWGEG